MRRDARRVVGVGAVLLLVGMGLSGCEALFDSAVTVQNGDVVFHYCYPMTGNVVKVLGVPPGHYHGYPTLWRATADSLVPVDQTINFGSPLAGFNAPTGTVDLSDKYRQLDVVIQRVKGTVLEDDRESFFEVSKISSKYWLRADGSQRDTPCDKS